MSADPNIGPTRSELRAQRRRRRAYREELRSRGLRPVRVWVTDMDSRDFRVEAHRQSLAVANSADGEHDQSFIDAASLWSND